MQLFRQIARTHLNTWFTQTHKLPMETGNLLVMFMETKYDFWDPISNGLSWLSTGSCHLLLARKIKAYVNFHVNYSREQISSGGVCKYYTLAFLDFLYCTVSLLMVAMESPVAGSFWSGFRSTSWSSSGLKNSIYFDISSMVSIKNGQYQCFCICCMGLRDYIFILTFCSCW